MAMESVNYEGVIPEVSGPFDIKCNSNTDLWDKPPSTHSFSSPIVYQTTNVGSFKSARVTVSAEWKDLYDQGGLALIINSKDSPRRWVKTGIEFLDNEAHISTVAKDNWSDWSLRPLASKTSTSATVELEKHEDGALWVYLLGEDGAKLPCREITWWKDVPRDAELWVGPYAAKPAKVDEQLVVNFKDLVINIE
jgi:regulation of enolase protein 1 (concanavalin A-like superfamily)